MDVIKSISQVYMVIYTTTLTLDLASVVFWCQDKAARLSRSFTKGERIHQPIIGLSEIHKWRDAWRRLVQMANNYQWGRLSRTYFKKMKRRG